MGKVSHFPLQLQFSILGLIFPSVVRYVPGCQVNTKSEDKGLHSIRNIKIIEKLCGISSLSFLLRHSPFLNQCFFPRNPTLTHKDIAFLGKPAIHSAPPPRFPAPEKKKNSRNDVSTHHIAHGYCTVYHPDHHSPPNQVSGFSETGKEISKIFLLYRVSCNFQLFLRSSYT